MTRPGNSRFVFTPARLEALKTHWEAGIDAEEIQRRLNALPGEFPVSSPRAVRHKATDLGLRRPERWRFLPRLWSDERRELLHNLINLIPDADVLERLNAMPGKPVKNIRAMRKCAQRLGYLAQRPRPRGPQQATWTEERRAYLRQHYGRIRPPELLQALQAMPGDPIPSIKTVRNAARCFGIPSPGNLRLPATAKTRAHAKPPTTFAPPAAELAPEPLTRKEQEANVLAMLAAREDKAIAMFSARKDAAAVSAALKIPLREAYRLQAQWRQQRQVAA